MRLFVVWTDMDLAKSLIRRLQAESHDVVYWVGRKGGGEEDFPDIIFHDHYDAWDGKPAPALASVEFEPASRELISKFHGVESLILTMMNKHFDWMGVDERRHVYYGMLSYWAGVLEKFKPEGVIFTTVPHTIYDYLLYELARASNLRTVMFRGTLPVAGRLLLYEDFRIGSRDLQEALKKNKNRVFSPAELSREWQEFYEKQTNASEDATPTYLKESRKRNSFLNRMRLKARAVKTAFKQGTFLEQALLRLVKSFKENIRDEHARVQSLPDFSQKFVYAPLHYQPESTSSPMGDVFADQILMVKTLSAALPNGWLIYVKEHPSQWFKRGFNFAGSRYRGYYEKIAAIPNVRLVPLATDNFTLITKAQAVATISGVSGSEALMRQRPVVVFGYPWYKDCPGIFKAENVETCRDAFSQIENGFSVDPKAVLNFIGTIDQIALRGYIDGYQQRVSGRLKEETLESISGAINYSLKRK